MRIYCVDSRQCLQVNDALSIGKFTLNDRTTMRKNRRRRQSLGIMQGQGHGRIEKVIEIKKTSDCHRMCSSEFLDVITLDARCKTVGNHQQRTLSNSKYISTII